MNTEQKEILAGVELSYSRGRGMGGKRHYYIRPKNYCFNNSRRVGGFTDDELFEAILNCARKWYYPIKYFKVDGHIIGSNTPENALREYWRVCDPVNIKKQFEVTDKTTPKNYQEDAL